jgi:hypothetical protein
MKKYTKYILIFFIIFFLGVFTEKFNLDNKISNNFKNLLDAGSRILYSFTAKEKVYIDIEPKEYEKILKIRKKALKAGLLTEDLHKWVPAKLKIKNISYDTKIRLKGVFPDHWSDPSRWSFKIKVNNNSKSIYGSRRFNLQPPNTMSYLYEWLLMKALKKEQLISLRTEYLEVIINGNSRGAYIFQDGISNEMLKTNDRVKGPIVGFNKNLYLIERKNERRLGELGLTGSLNGVEDTFWRAKIDSVQFSEDQIEKKQGAYLTKAIYLLESFRDGSLKPSEVFDTNKLAKIMAIRAVLGSSEFDYRDTKFYFNPETSLLEPVTKESHVSLDLNFKDHYFSWWIDSSHVKPHYTNNTNFFLDILYKDYKFYKSYLSELNKFSKKKYFEDLIDDNKIEYKKNLKILKQNYPTKEIFSKNHLDITRHRIQDFLNPVQGLNVYFSDYKENFLSLNISNLQRLPVEITGIEFKDKSKIFLKESVIIEGKKPYLSTKNNVIKFDCLFKYECKKLSIDKQKVIFKILGQNIDKKANISRDYFKK